MANITIDRDYFQRLLQMVEDWEATLDVHQALQDGKAMLTASMARDNEIRVAVYGHDGKFLFARNAVDTDADPDIHRAREAGFKVGRAKPGD